MPDIGNDNLFIGIKEFMIFKISCDKDVGSSLDGLWEAERLLRPHKRRFFERF